MSAFFKLPTQDETLLVADIESGGVASALVRFSAESKPFIFAEFRAALPVSNSVSGEVLAQKTLVSFVEALGQTSRAASRLRQHEHTAPLGTVSGVHIFLHAPWVHTISQEGALSWIFEQAVSHQVKMRTQAAFGTLPTTQHSFASALPHAVPILSPEKTLACVITGEIVELLVVNSGTVLARATFPFGVHTLLRTAAVHGGYSHHETRSALELLLATPKLASPILGPLRAAGEHAMSHFIDTAQELLATHLIKSIVVVGPEAVAEWFARTLTEDASISHMFPHGGVARALLPRHVQPFVATETFTPNISLMLEALFIDRSQNLVY